MPTAAVIDLVLDLDRNRLIARLKVAGVVASPCPAQGTRRDRAPEDRRLSRRLVHVAAPRSVAAPTLRRSRASDFGRQFFRADDERPNSIDIHSNDR
jgi:hypothetical protein